MQTQKAAPPRYRAHELFLIHALNYFLSKLNNLNFLINIKVCIVITIITEMMSQFLISTDSLVTSTAHRRKSEDNSILENSSDHNFMPF